jgi:hypothetical protein
MAATSKIRSWPKYIAGPRYSILGLMWLEAFFSSAVVLGKCLGMGKMDLAFQYGCQEEKWLSRSIVNYCKLHSNFALYQFRIEPVYNRIQLLF